MRRRRRARTSDLMIRSPPPRWDTILDRIASDRCQPRVGLQGTELARISQRVMRTSSSDPKGAVSISRNGTSWNIDSGSASLRLDVEGPDDVAPLLRSVGDELAEVVGRTQERCATQIGEPRLDLMIGESGVDLLVELLDDRGGRIPRRPEAERAGDLLA